MTEIRLYKSIWNGLKIILLCSIFVMPCSYFLITGKDNSWPIWMGVFLFGIGYPVGLYAILDRRPHIIINELGIFDRSLGKNVINWEIINDAYPADINGQKFICLVVDEDFEPSRKKGKIYKSFSRLNKELGFQELNLAVSIVHANSEKLLTLIHLMIRAEKPEREKLLISGI